MVSPPEKHYTLPPLLLWGFCLTHAHTPPTYPSLHSPTLGNWGSTGPKTSPHIDAQQGLTLLYMWVEPEVHPCVCLGWWFNPWDCLGAGGALFGWYCVMACVVANTFISSPTSVLSLPSYTLTCIPCLSALSPDFNMWHSFFRHALSVSFT